MREIQRETSGEIMAEALEVVKLNKLVFGLSCYKVLSTSERRATLQDNIFEWHFAIRGPPDTEFEVCQYKGTCSTALCGTKRSVTCLFLLSIHIW